MKDIIDAYYEARQALIDAFGVEESEYFEFQLNDEFYFYESDMNLEYSSFDDDDLYSYESAQLIIIVDGYQLYWITDNGQTFYAVFHTDNELTDEQAEIKFG